MKQNCIHHRLSCAEYKCRENDTWMHDEPRGLPTHLSLRIYRFRSVVTRLLMIALSGN